MDPPSSTTDFQTKARMAASQISSMSPAEAMAKSLISERPTIDSAIKSYMSLCAARSMSASSPKSNSKLNSMSSAASLLKDALATTVQNSNNNMIQSDFHSKSSNDKDDTKDKNGDEIKCFFTRGTNPNQAALLCARSLLKCINSFTVPEYNKNESSQTTAASSTTTSTNKKEEEEKKSNNDNEHKVLEYEVVRILWNGLIKNGKKPSMILGQTSLIHVYPLIQKTFFVERNQNDNNENVYFPNNVDLEEAKSFIIEFGGLLQNAHDRKNGLTNGISDKDDNDNDSSLLWDIDGGKAELQRRRKRREVKQQKYNAFIDEENKNHLLTIEEINDDVCKE